MSVSQNRGGIGNPNHDELGRFASAAKDAAKHPDTLSQKELRLKEKENIDFSRWSDKDLRYYADNNISMPILMRKSDSIKKALSKENLIINNNDELDKMGIDLLSYNGNPDDMFEIEPDGFINIYKNVDYIDVKTSYADKISLPFINVEPDQNGIFKMRKGLLIADRTEFELGKTKVSNYYLFHFLEQSIDMDNRTRARQIKELGSDAFIDKYIYPNSQELYLINKDALFDYIYQTYSEKSLNALYSVFNSSFNSNGISSKSFEEFIGIFSKLNFKVSPRKDHVEVSKYIGNGLYMTGKLYNNRPFFDMHFNIDITKNKTKEVFNLTKV